MGSFNSAFFQPENREIKLEEYTRYPYYGNLYCPECKEAKIHYKLTKPRPYFSSNRKNEHSEYCSHYGELVSNTYLIRIAKNNPTKFERLIRSGLTAAMNLLVKNEAPTSLVDKKRILLIAGTKNRKIKTKTVSKCISIIKFDTLNIDQNYFDQYKIVYGIANIERVEGKIKATLQDAGRKEGDADENNKSSDILKFKRDNQLIFSIFLSEKVGKHISLELGEHVGMNFAVFGKIIKREKRYINLILQHSDHFENR